MDTTSSMLPLIVAAPFLGALLPGLMIRAGRDTCTWFTLLPTALALLMLVLHAPAVIAGEVFHYRLAWLPSLGMNVNLMLDGLGLMFAGLILGIGLLIILYARFYLYRSDPMGQFFTYLLLFQGAMVGIVLSDNILLLLIFWELTSLSSFLLIGYWNHLPEGRQGARMALAVTGLGGLALIGGLLILGNIAGSYDISVILQNSEAIQGSEWYLPALILILIGCFTKSAQFPFHFWLPHAMAAPTPVSAYLHSATMVKAGLFLMARLWPVLSGTPEWFYIVATTGLITMVIGAGIALFKDDLKALLAFSTVSHLGLITMLLGFGTEAAALAATVHILAHASFKAALFMTAGIIDHETGTRDIPRLGGLRQLMPTTFAIGALTALSMAGIPPLNGFISKEMMLEEATHTVWAGTPWLLPALAGLGALFSVAYSFRFLVHVFFGPVREDYPKPPHDPPFGMWAGPGLLALVVVVTGLFPALVTPFVDAVAAAITGGHPHAHLSLWHGFTPALYISVAAILGGALLLALHRPLATGWRRAGPPYAKAIFDAVVGAATRGARGVTDGLHDGAMTRYAAILTLATLGAGAIAWSNGEAGPPTRALLPVSLLPAIAVALLVVSTATLVVLHRRRLVALVLLGVVGLVVAIGFIYFSAPDLAMTQLSVEVVTIILLLLALNFLPQEDPPEDSMSRKIRDGVIAGLGGLGVAVVAFAMLTRDFALPAISEYHIANAYKGAGGSNIVNVILVDFRGFDTFGEIIVLGIAALVIFALTEQVLRGPGADWLANWKGARREAGDRHPLLMVIATRVMMPMALMVGVYVFLRGHNEPGGGFIAGLVVAIALLMQYMASGFAWAEERRRLPYHTVIGLGVLISILTGLGAWFNGMPFLTSAFGYVEIPPLEEFELATAMLFDLGVFLTVLGAVMLALASLSSVARRTGEKVNVHAMDVNPLRGRPGGEED